jgi:hypothetical protein
MKTIYAKVEGREFTFRTNNNGEYLFVGQSENSQISTESGYNSISKIKKHIRVYLQNKFHRDSTNIDYKLPRIKFSVNPGSDFTK